jgi:hypothetical protein
MSDEHAIDDDPAVTATDRQETRAREPIDDDRWLEDSAELPRRPRRRLLRPLPLALLGVLGIACGFIGGVLVEKGQSASSSSASAAPGLASRLAALRGRGASPGANGANAGSARFSGSPGSGGLRRPTAGQVAYLSGHTLYVTDSEGNTVKVTTTAGTSVTKTVKASVKGIHPGETVTVIGEAASSGAVSAESISVGSGGSGVAALFGGLSSRGSGSSSRGSGSSGAGAGGGGAPSGGPALFGSG